MVVSQITQDQDMSAQLAEKSQCWEKPLSQRMIDFSQDTSMHGVQYVGKLELCALRR